MVNCHGVVPTTSGQRLMLYVDEESRAGLLEHPTDIETPARFAQQREAVVDSGLTATEKLVTLKSRLRANPKPLSGAYPSLATLARAASLKKERSVREVVKGL